MDRLLTVTSTEDIAWHYITPHAAQQQIIESSARYRVLACGRRFGKTDLCIYRVGSQALETGLPYAYFAPTYKMLSDVWRAFKMSLYSQMTYKNETDKRIELVSGGAVDFWSLDNPNAARGRKYAGIVVDEAAFVPDLEYAWQFVLQPTLTDLSGWAWFPSTPNGRSYFWALWMMGKSPGFPDWQSWSFPTSANPYILPEEIEEKRLLLPERAFRQEYLAEFLEDSGAVFRRVLDCATVETPAGPVEGHTYVFGVDWGRDNDFTAISVMDATARELVALEHFNEIGWALQRGRLVALYEHWKPERIMAEANSIGGPNIEALQGEGLPVIPFTTTAASKGPLIESLALAFERGEIAIINDPVLVNELLAYTMERLASGRWQYSAPAGLHDDTVISTALAWHGVVQPHSLIAFV